jgi:phosphopantetheinyl transferase
MPLAKIVQDKDGVWAIWKITEEEDLLREHLQFDEGIPESITNPKKRLEWLGGRIIVKAMLNAINLPFNGVVKDEHGKPFPKGHRHQLSLSHSFPYVAGLVDEHVPGGIDREQPKTKLLSLAPRILHPEELQDAGSDVQKHCVYWCAKESLVKVHGKKDLTFAENLIINPFSLKNEGDIVGRIIVKGSERVIPLHYQVTDDFVMVLSKQTAT